MGDITPEELGRGFRLLMTIGGIVTAIVLAVLGFIKLFITRREHEKDIAELLAAVKDLQHSMSGIQERQGKMTPEAEAQMIKILGKIDEFFTEKQRRKHG